MKGLESFARLFGLSDATTAEPEVVTEPEVGMSADGGHVYVKSGLATTEDGEQRDHGRRYISRAAVDLRRAADLFEANSASIANIPLTEVAKADGSEPFSNPVRNRGINTGRQQAASGDGADAMTREFSDPQKGNGIAEAYQRLADELRETRESLKAVTATAEANSLALSSIAGMLKSAAEDAGHRFPEDEDGQVDDEDDDDEDDESVTKGIPTLSVPAVMDALSAITAKAGAATNGRTPPNFMQKSGPTVSEIDAAIDDAQTPTEATYLATLKARTQAVAAGMANPRVLDDLAYAVNKDRRVSDATRQFIVGR